MNIKKFLFYPGSNSRLWILQSKSLTNWANQESNSNTDWHTQRTTATKKKKKKKSRRIESLLDFFTCVEKCPSVFTGCGEAFVLW